MQRGTLLAVALRSAPDVRIAMLKAGVRARSDGPQQG